MARHKAAKNCTVLPWLSSRKDNEEGRFIQVGNSLLLTRKDENGTERNRFLQLSFAARFCYLCMTLEAAGKRSFEFPLKAAKKYNIPPATFRRSVKELEAAQFIVKQSGKTVRQPNLYDFCFDWKPG